MGLIQSINTHFDTENKTVQLADKSALRDRIGIVGGTAIATALIAQAFFSVPSAVAHVVYLVGAGLLASCQTGKDGYAIAAATVGLTAIAISNLTMGYMICRELSWYVCYCW